MMAGASSVPAAAWRATASPRPLRAGVGAASAAAPPVSGSSALEVPGILDQPADLFRRNAPGGEILGGIVDHAAGRGAEHLVVEILHVARLLQRRRQLAEDGIPQRLAGAFRHRNVEAVLRRLALHVQA